jgi:hypothetical protein
MFNASVWFPELPVAAALLRAARRAAGACWGLTLVSMLSAACGGGTATPGQPLASPATGSAGTTTSPAPSNVAGSSAGSAAQPTAGSSSAAAGVVGAAVSGSGGDTGSARGGDTTPGNAGTSGSGTGGDAAAAGSRGAAGTQAGNGSGALPAITDPGATGPFTIMTTNSTGPSNNYTAFYPAELGKGGIKHPIVIWGNGAVLNPSSYPALLNHLASHGFAILAFNTTPQAADMKAALDWMIAEATRDGSVFKDKLDTTKVAAMGHSAGSLATFGIAGDARLTTTMHLDGGTMSPHTDAMNLKKPAAFICGDSGGDGLITGDVARPNCDIDYMSATTPVWYGDVIGASHLTITGATASDPKLQAFLIATAAWLRWQLADDQTMKAYFVPTPGCTLCMQSSLWTVQSKNL